jgi:hypothetical protein
MDDSGEKLYRWSILVNTPRWTCVGICQVQQASSRRFEEFGLDRMGHGHYCLASSGYVYSHSDRKVNFESKSFTFRAGNVLHFEYSQANGKLRV